jgi:hypothetical protein
MGELKRAVSARANAAIRAVNAAAAEATVGRCTLTPPDP